MLMRHPHPEFQFTHALPYGAVVHDRGVQFVVFSRSATAMRVLLYDHVDDREPADVIRLRSATPIAGAMCGVSLFLASDPGNCITSKPMGRLIPSGHWFDGEARLIDPYAKALAGCFQKARRRLFVRPSAW